MSKFVSVINIKLFFWIFVNANAGLPQETEMTLHDLLSVRYCYQRRRYSRFKGICGPHLQGKRLLKYVALNS
jgi:hypothetical protein